MRDEKKFSYFEFEVGRYEPNCWDSDEAKKTFKPYRPDTKKLSWYVFAEDVNAKKIVPVNLFEYNWVFLRDGLLYAKKHYASDYNKFADHIRSWLSHEYWARCEYETIICGWPAGTRLTQSELTEIQKELDDKKVEFAEHGYTWEPSVDIGYPEPCYKMDVYTQVMMNWDRFIEYLWNNKRLITKNKLGLK